MDENINIDIETYQRVTQEELERLRNEVFSLRVVVAQYEANAAREVKTEQSPISEANFESLHEVK